MSYFAILGNTPELSALELGQSWPGGQVLRLKQPPDITRLGGTIKIAEEMFELSRNLTDIERIYVILEQLSRRISFGFSVYAGTAHISNALLKQYAKQLERIGIAWKKKLRQQGWTVRYVTSREPALSSVIVTREHLLKHQTDFVLVIEPTTIRVGRTSAVQDYRSFSDRDYGRPGRDAHAGMLPPKVARMMVNIAQAKPTDRILDPFCGSGTILQEALLLSYPQVIGSDLSPKAITDTTTNLAWLKLSPAALHVHDATRLTEIIKPNSIVAIVTEGYLGPIRPHNINQILAELTRLYANVWQEFAHVLQPGGRVIMAIPAWRRHEHITTLPLNKIIPQRRFRAWHAPIFYGRPDAQVMRQILFYSVY